MEADTTDPNGTDILIATHFCIPKNAFKASCKLKLDVDYLRSRIFCLK